MKTFQYIFSALFLCSGIFTACQNEKEELPSQLPVKGAISVTSLKQLDNETPETYVSSKANGDETLTYTVEVWTQENSPRCMLHQTATGTITSGVVFDIALIPGKYDFLFWADYGTGDYLTANLREVTIAPFFPNNNRDAFAAVMKDITWGERTDFNAVLKRPLAKLKIANSSSFSSSQNVSLTFSYLYTQYDVMTGSVSVPQENISWTFPNTTVGDNAVAEDFLFALPSDEDISVSVNVGNNSKTLDNIPLKPNYNTNVTSTF